MAIICPICRRQYDVTLFEFGNTVECDCGARIRFDPAKGLIIAVDRTKRERCSASSPISQK